MFVAGRLGLGVNFRLSDCVLFGVEVNANMLSDKYNSKKAGNLDWQFNALGGFTFRFGKNHKKARTAAVVPAPAPTPAPEPAPGSRRREARGEGDACSGSCGRCRATGRTA